MDFWDKGNKFPYTNNHDANLDYMMTIFENIKNEWHYLYVDLVEWKGTTTLELNTWKTNALAQIEQYETDFRAEIVEWKANTEQDIGVWEQSVLADLGTWRANFETLFATTFSNLTQIKTDAEAARDAAAESAEAAEDSADEAAASAESVSESLAQIAQNAADVADLKTQLKDITGVPSLQFSPGYIRIVTKGSAADLTPLTNAGNEYIIDDCAIGDTYTIFSKPGYSAGRLFMFVDSDGNCATATIASYDLNGFVVSAPVDGKFVLNADATNPHFVYKNAINLKGIIDKNYSDIREIIFDDADISSISPYETESGVVYSTQHPAGLALAGYRTFKYNVDRNDFLHVVVSVPNNDRYKTALFFDADGNIVGYIEPNRADSVQDVRFIVPEYATKMYLSTSGSSATVEKYTHSKNVKNVTYKDGLLVITTNDFIMSMCKRGNNNLWDFWKIFKADGTLIWQYSSDLMGPYVVQALENADGDDQRATYTGGNHAYNYDDGGITGTPTAITNDITIFADGKEVTDGDNIAWSNEISVTWTNDVQAWNTKKADGTGRAVLRENPTWTFKPDGTIIVQNYIRALEDIKITLYYGLQAQVGWMNKGIFIPSVSRIPVAMSRFIPSDLGVSFEGTEMTGADTNLILKIGYNPDIDLGTGVGMGEDNRTLRLHANTSKLYTVMISSTDFTLDENAIATFEGYYKFINPETVLLSEFLA